MAPAKALNSRCLRLGRVSHRSLQREKPTELVTAIAAHTTQIATMYTCLSQGVDTNKPATKKGNVRERSHLHPQDGNAIVVLTVMGNSATVLAESLILIANWMSQIPVRQMAFAEASQMSVFPRPIHYGSFSTHGIKIYLSPIGLDDLFGHPL